MYRKLIEMAMKAYMKQLLASPSVQDNVGMQEVQISYSRHSDGEAKMTFLVYGANDHAGRVTAWSDPRDTLTEAIKSLEQKLEDEEG